MSFLTISSRNIKPDSRRPGAHAYVKTQNGTVLDGKIITIENLRIEIARCEVYVDDLQIVLQPRPYAVLVALAENIGQVLSRAQLLEILSPDSFEGGERTIDVHIRRLRCALGSALLSDN